MNYPLGMNYWNREIAKSKRVTRKQMNLVKVLAVLVILGGFAA